MPVEHEVIVFTPLADLIHMGSYESLAYFGKTRVSKDALKFGDIGRILTMIMVSPTCDAGLSFR